MFLAKSFEDLHRFLLANQQRWDVPSKAKPRFNIVHILNSKDCTLFSQRNLLVYFLVGVRGLSVRLFVHGWYVRGKRDGEVGDGKAVEGKEERRAGLKDEN